MTSFVQIKKRIRYLVLVNGRESRYLYTREEVRRAKRLLKHWHEPAEPAKRRPWCKRERGCLMAQIVEGQSLAYCRPCARVARDQERARLRYRGG